MANCAGGAAVMVAAPLHFVRISGVASINKYCYTQRFVATCASATFVPGLGRFFTYVDLRTSAAAHENKS